MKIYVGNLPVDVTESEVRAAFEPFGPIESVALVKRTKEKRTEESKGFGFVEISDRAKAESAITALNGKELRGHALIVNEARARAEGPRK